VSVKHRDMTVLENRKVSTYFSSVIVFIKFWGGFCLFRVGSSGQDKM